MILITRPEYDDGTEYLSLYSLLIIKEAQDRDIQIKDFEGKEANRENALKFLIKKNPKTLFINGHGDEKHLYASNNEILFSLKDLNLLKDKIIYARACCAGAFLGERIVENNNGCFIGYKFPFSFWIDESHSATPLKDNTARIYLEPSNEIMSSLIKGKTTLESYNKSKEMMIKNMQKLIRLKDNNQPGAINMLQVLWNNFEGQVIYGNQNIILK